MPSGPSWARCGDPSTSCGPYCAGAPSRAQGRKRGGPAYAWAARAAARAPESKMIIDPVITDRSPETKKRAPIGRYRYPFSSYSLNFQHIESVLSRDRDPVDHSLQRVDRDQCPLLDSFHIREDFSR
jgi:hypothetical protein